ncbi:GNAT family N-acetyltransferase [Paraburkholderia sp. SIMBA_030]|uniref:GNAT family N-acetyltransferase n=1 Tax=Paraburkholderia sp. SIMBA_030 TaxID=3085773 RepID=UPI00397E78B6
MNKPGLLLPGAPAVKWTSPWTEAPLTNEVREIESLATLTSLREAWRALSANADDCPGHMTFEYCELAASHALAKGESVSVAMVYGDRSLLALWPVSVVRRGLVRVARGLTCGTGEEYGQPLVRAGANRAVYAAAVAAIRQVDADILEIPLVRRGSVLQEALDALPQSWVLARVPARWRVLPGFSIVLRDVPRWSDFVSTLPKSLRSTLRYRHKRLEAQGHPEFGWCRTVSDAVAVLSWLFDMKRRWAARRGVSVSYLRDARVRDFFIELARRTDLSTVPLVAFVKVEGVPVAASVNLVGSRTVEGFVTTYDEAFARCSVGALLAEFLVKWSHANGRDFDFRPLYAEYKANWANRRTWHETHVVMLRTRGRLAEFSLLFGQLLRVQRKCSEFAVRLLKGTHGA